MALLSLVVLPAFTQSSRYLEYAYQNVSNHDFDKAEKNYRIYRELSGKRDYNLEAKLKIRFVNTLSYNPVSISFKGMTTQLATELDKAIIIEFSRLAKENSRRDDTNNTNFYTVRITSYPDQKSGDYSRNMNLARQRAEYIATQTGEPCDIKIIPHKDINNQIILSLSSTMTLVDIQPKTGNIPEGCVDMGLSVYWGTCNVGAKRPQDYGEFFSWGDVEPKYNYNKGTTKTFGIQMKDISGNPQYDAATKNNGNGWRTPTRSEIDELLENTSTQWTTVDGVKGILVTSNRNGNSIFLPACGYRTGTARRPGGADGGYWGSTPSDDGNFAYSMIISKNGLGYHSYERHGGFCIRPVHDY